MTGVTAMREDPVWIESGEEHIFAMVTQPSDEANGYGVLLLPGGGWMPSTMRNRMYVDLARRLASHGATVVRVDYRGVGESTGTTPFFDLTRPASADVLGAADLLKELGCRKIIAVGACYGGRAALAALAQSPDLAGLLMSATPVEDYAGASKSIGWHARRAFSKQTLRNLRARYRKYLRILARLAIQSVQPSRRGQASETTMSAEYSGPLISILHRGVPTLILYGREDRHYPPFEAALSGPIGLKLRASPSLEVEIFEGELHGELTFESQRFASERMERFVLGVMGDESS